MQYTEKKNIMLPPSTEIKNNNVNLFHIDDCLYLPFFFNFEPVIPITQVLKQSECILQMKLI